MPNRRSKPGPFSRDQAITDVDRRTRAGRVMKSVITELTVGGITDEIMAEIRQSRFVIADYTGQKNGVYFEAGFALKLGLTVIPTCRTDEVGKLHFDIKHHCCPVN